MIVLVCDDFIRKIGKLDQLFYKVGDETSFHIIPFTLSLVKSTGDSIEEWFRPTLIQAVKQATTILLMLQPTKKDLKDPYFDYLPLIYSFLDYHPSIKNKTFIIQPFYYPNNNELKNIFAEKIRLGDFKEVPFETLCSLPANLEQVEKMQNTIINFIENDLNRLH